MSKDPFYLHKIALRPLLCAPGRQVPGEWFRELEVLEPNTFLAFLYRQGLAQMWLPLLLEQDELPSGFDTIINELKHNALTAAAGQLMQRKILQDTRDVLSQAGIDYLVFKGAQLRHTIYTEPTQRPVCDIDVLIREEHKFTAIEALQQAGFSAHHLAENISHETSLVHKDVCIDLHWRLLRPGRTRIDLNNYLFAQRRAFGEFEGLSNEAGLLVMLIHPAITKYVNGSASSLRHLVDIHRLAQCEDINWQRLVEMLRASGTRTAAWASLSWLRMLMDEAMYEDRYEDLAAQLRPGGLKARWLNYWMRKDLNVKLEDHRLLIRGGFSLVLQDSLKDAFRALLTLQKLRREALKNGFP